MKKIKRLAAGIICIILICVSVSGCGLFKSSPEDEQKKFDKFCEDMFRDELKSDPFNAHFLVSDASKYGVEYKKEDMNFGSVSLDEIKQSYKDVSSTLKQLKKFDRGSLTDKQKLTYDTLLAYLNTQIAYEGTELVNCYFGPMNGIIANLSTDFIEYCFYDKKDVDDYLLFLSDTDRFMEDLFELTREQAKKGYFLSDRNADKVIESCKKILEAEQEPLIVTFEKKLEKLDLTDAEKESYIKTNKEYVETKYLPVYEKTIKLMEELKGSSSNKGGLCGYGDVGKKYYKALIMNDTSCDTTPEKLVELLESTLSDLIKEATAIAVSDYESYEFAITYQPDFKSADEVVQFLLKNIEKDFPKPLTSEYNIEYQDKSCEIDGVVAYYVLSRIDNIHVNNIKVNGSAVEGDTLSLYTTLAHEGYPGHLYQHTILCNDNETPDIMKKMGFLGAMEGWAQYTSNCAVDYLDIPYNVKRIIFINDILSYILISRIDIGVNYEGWDYDDVYELISDYYEADRNYDDEDNIVSYFYDIVTGDPGTFLPYTIGYIKTLKMREHAEKELGSKFNPVEYHEWYTGVGITSFDIYEDLLDDWIASKK